jgi:hypothetical protein
MNKKLLMSLPVFLTICGFSTISYASTGYDTDGQVSFFEGSDITTPVVMPNNPDPNLPVIPQNPDGTEPTPGTAGPLSIDFASSFDFGVNPISNKDQTYFAKSQSYFDSKTKTSNYIQVTDNRGTLAGWSLSVTESGQLQNESSKEYPTLDGATISLTHPILSSLSNAPSPVTQPVIDLVPNTKAIVATASNGTGAGTWVTSWGEQGDLRIQDMKSINPSVKLFVPGTTGKEAGTYKTTLIWSLSSLPIN